MSHGATPTTPLERGVLEVLNIKKKLTTQKGQVHCSRVQALTDTCLQALQSADLHALLTVLRKYSDVIENTKEIMGGKYFCTCVRTWEILRVCFFVLLKFSKYLPPTKFF